MAHYEQLGVRLLHRFSMKFQRSLVEPFRPWFLVVVKAEPDVSELAHLRVVVAPPQVYDVSYAEGS